jgi:capsular exopolysaccharide synthesis family protein
MSDQLNFDDQSAREQKPKLRLAVPGEAPARAEARPASYAVADSAELPTTHLTDYVKVLYKRRWVAMTSFALVVLAATVYSFTATPIYEAKTRLLIEAEEHNVVSFKQVLEEDQQKADYYQTQYNILQSRVLARKTIDTLKLWDSPHLGAPSKETSFSLRQTIGGAFAAVTRAFGSGEAAATHEPAAADETMAQSRAIDAFLLKLTVSPIRNSRLVDIRYRLSDPGLAASIVNTLAKSYIEQNLEYKFLASKEASDWLGERLVEERKKVEQAESALQRYREQNDALSLQDRENIVVQKLTDLNAAVTRAKTERITKEAMYNQLRGIQANTSALDTFPAILGNTFIQQQKAELSDLQRQHAQLSEKFGEKHPDIIRLARAIQTSQTKLQAEITKVVASVKNDYEAALAQERSLNAALGQQKGEAMSMNRKAIDYAVLDREVQSSKQIYDSLMQRAKETGVSGELKTSNIRVVDRAEQPRLPVTPQKTLNLLVAIFGGGILACLLAFFFESMDSRVKSPDEIKGHLALPCLGLVPALDPKVFKDAEPLISNGVPPNFGEAFRGLRTNVLFSSAQEGSRSLVVTSTGPGEGKTLVASNLAIGFAQAGQRVLLIDADMRRPRVHECFKAQQEPGLSNLLVGTAKASETVRKTEVPGLWMMPSGHIPPNPAELLGSQRFKDFLHSLGAHFDWVIVDTPPVMAVTDATIVAHQATGVVFVVGAEMTSRHNARHAVEQLHKGHARFVGAVLNRVEVERNAYYYSQYYRREYAAYYQAASGSGR